MSRLLYLAFFCCCLQPSFAQKTSAPHPAVLGLSFLLNDFKSKCVFSDFSRMDAGLALSYLKGISQRLDYAVSLSGSFPDSVSKRSPASGTKNLLLEADLMLRGRLRTAEKKAQPFLASGIGLSTYPGTFASYAAIGPGLELNYKDVYLLASAQYRAALFGSLNAHFFYSVGIAGLVGRKAVRKKPVPAAVPVRIKDSDGDGIPDTEDACPLVPGLSRFQGCPDSDGDGIEDRLDQCPYVPGVARYQGCPVPDRDKDGINDEEDRCPDVPGLKRYQGCPIPDTDADGTNDEEDSCITVPGPKDNHGCPLLKDQLRQKIDFAARHILFRTGSYELLKASFAPLDEVVQVMKAHPSLSITIEGHTDNEGQAQANLALSEQRAKAVRDYLIQQGIDPARITAKGFGRSRPVASNRTAEGRASNRRVQFILSGD